MKSVFDKLNLRPFERRLVVIGAVALFVVLNIALVWPHFGDWGRVQERMGNAQNTLKNRQKLIDQTRGIQEKIRELEQEGASVSTDDEANEFLRTVQSQAAQNQVNITGTSRQNMRTNEFFLETTQTFNLQTGEEELVGFLYNLGSSDSMIRVRDLALRPDPARQQLSGSVRLVASYQKTARRPTPTPATASSARPSPRQESNR